MKKSISSLFSNDAVELLQNALSPIEIRKINVNNEEGIISIVVEDEDFAAVLGKRGMNARLNSQLIGYDLEIQKMTDYNRAMAIQRTELAASDDPTLDEPLTSIDGINPLMFPLIKEHLVAEGLDTPRALLRATAEKLATIPGINLETADKILDQIRKQRM